MRWFLLLTFLLTFACRFSAQAEARPVAFMSATRALSVPFAQVLSFLTPGTRVREITEGDPLATEIDSGLLEVLATPTGRVFCGVIIDDEEVIWKSFFLKRSSAKLAQKTCRGLFASRMTHRPFVKRYFIAEAEDGELKVAGWTTPANETVVFTHKGLLTRERLLRTLIHELAISYDRKEQIGFAGILDFPKLGLIENSDSCDLKKAIHHPLIKHSLSAIRAFTVEAQVAREMGLELPRGFAEWERVSCVDRLRFMAPYSLHWQDALAAEAWANEILSGAASISRFSIYPVEPARWDVSSDYEKLLTLFAKFTITFADGTTRNACDYLTEGLPYTPGLSFGGGPGPNIGGTGWRSLIQGGPK